MKHISQATKEAFVRKALSQPNVKLKEFAKLNNIGYSSITKWIKQYKNTTTKLSSNYKITRLERVKHVLATSRLNENELGHYCREHGLYTSQLETWKKELMNNDNDEKNQSLQAKLKELKLENENLKKEMRRKEKALAETAALLVLKKKVNALLGEDEDV